MATRPAKGKLFLSPPPLWMHGEVSPSNAAGRMCTMPVARMTPAANALTAKKMSPSGRSGAKERPSTGTSTPAAPAVRMDAMATSFSFIAPCLSAPSVAVVHSHPPLATACCTNRRSHGRSACKGDGANAGYFNIGGVGVRVRRVVVLCPGGVCCSQGCTSYVPCVTNLGAKCVDARNFNDMVSADWILCTFGKCFHPGSEDPRAKLRLVFIHGHRPSARLSETWISSSGDGCRVALLACLVADRWMDEGG